MCIRILAQSYGSYQFGDKVWDMVEGETMEILSRDKVPLGDNKGATGRKLYLRHELAQFNVSSFLDLYASKGLHSYIWKGSLRSFISSQEIFIPPELSLSLYGSHPDIFHPCHRGAY